MSVVDFHTHYYPPEYITALREWGSAVKVTTDAQDNPVLHYPGDYNTAVPGHRDLAVKERDMAAAGVDVQIATLTTPGVHVETPALAVRLARLVNDAFAAAMRRAGGHFMPLATLPLNDPVASVTELRRAMKELGLRGAMVFSNVNGVALADPRYEPLWREADALGAVIQVHPTHPVGVEAMTDFWLMPLVGFPWDTTLAAAKLVFAGVPARHPGIRWVLGHLGGAIPYIAERLDRGWRAFEECREHIDQPPSTYLREFYFDTVNFDPAALRLALSFAGAGHLLAGSDYPHAIGSMALMNSSLRGMGLSARDEAAVMGANAARLMGF